MSQPEITQYRFRRNKKFVTKEFKEQNMNIPNIINSPKLINKGTPIISTIPDKKITELVNDLEKKNNNIIICISSDEEIKDKSTLKKIKHPLKTISISSDDDYQPTQSQSIKKIKKAAIIQKPLKYLKNLESDFENKKNIPTLSKRKLRNCKEVTANIQSKKYLINSDSDFEEEKYIPTTSIKNTNFKISLKGLETPKISSRKHNKTEVTSKIKRKLTNSTNLKNFSAKNQPISQKYIKQYFTQMPKNTIGYFDTFKESYQSNNIKDNIRSIKVEKYLENNYFTLLKDDQVFKINDLPPKDNSPLVDSSKIIARKRLLFSNDNDIKLEANQNLNDSINDRILIKNELINQGINSTEVNSKLHTSSSSKLAKTENKKGQRRKIECPEYKVVENTSFAVDAFRFGEIEGVTHYFLTHFHADHYIGLTKKFCKPIYMSKITATLVDSFIRVDKQYIHIIPLNESVFINSNDTVIEITAIDANHCPGAVMFIFKFPDYKCYLHTGDFRASSFMESEPFFWNNTIDIVYLDTTYLNKKYAFKDQSDSLNDLEEIVENFRMKNIGKKILYICGSYLIGKEKVWNKLHELIGGLIYVDKNRKKALEAIGDISISHYLVDDPHMADIHVLSMNQISYLKLWDYLKEFEDEYDLILAIRASGWERNSKPQYGGKINIVGIEYSEHSSYTELRRFIRFLQPKKIISTVPNGSDLSKTCQIPISWYNNEVKPKQQGFQKSITNYIFKLNSANNSHDESQNIILDATLPTTFNSNSDLETEWMF